MDVFSRLKIRTKEKDETILLDCIDMAKSVILARRFPFGGAPDEVEDCYLDLQYRIALDLYNKSDVEGETSHSEDDIKRVYESSWVSAQLLQEITPKVGGLK